MNSSRSFLLCAALSAGACATSNSASNTPSGNTPPATAEPAATSADGGPAVLPELPAPGLAQGAMLSLDQRGAFGPVMATHLDIFADDTARCFRRRAMRPDEQNQITLNVEQKQNIQAALEKNATHTARQVARKGIVQDIGTVTISMLKDGQELQVITDGANTVDPPQGDVTILLNAITQACLEAAGSPK